MAGQDDGWETITDPTDVPPDIRKSLGVKGVRTALGIDADDDAKGGGKPIPQWAEKKYSPQVETFAGLSSSLNGFKDEYGGNTFTGGLENTIQGAISGFGSDGQRDWWATFKSNDNQIRNKLFGSALTDTEKKAYESTTISPSMDPKEIRRNLATRRGIVQKALQRTTKFLRAQGYSGDAISALAGEYAPELGATEAPAAKGGDQSSGTAGVAANGSATPPSGPGVPPTVDGSPTELVRGDQAPQEMAASVADFTPEQRTAIATIARTGTPDQVKAVLSGFGRAFAGSDEDLSKLMAFYKDPKNANVPLNLPESDKTLQPVDAGDGAIGAAARGAGSFLTAGFLDEAGALADTVARGGTYAENLDTRRGQEKFDEENHQYARIGGQLIAGTVLPSRIAGAFTEAALGAARSGRAAALAAGARGAGIQGAKEGAAYGGAYGVGDADGGFGSRVAGGVIGGTVGGAAGGLTAFSGARAANAIAQRARVASRAMPTDAQEFGAAAERQGIEYLPADVPDATKTRMATGVAGMTLGGIPLAEAAQKTIASAKGARDRIAAGLGIVADDAGAGQAAQRGARRWIASSEKRASSLYDRIPIRPQTDASVGNSRAVLADLTAGLESNPELSALVADPRLNAFEAAFAGRSEVVPTGLLDSAGKPLTRTVQKGGALSWQDLKAFRTYVGEKAGAPELQSDTSKKALKALYGALSEDMRATAAKQGGGALTAFNRANTFFRGRQDRIENVLSDVLGNDLNKGAEAAFRSIETMVRDNTANAGKVARLLRSMPDDEANTVRASILGQLGDASAGRQDRVGDVFSPGEFMTQWNKLSDRAKGVLFKGDHREAINDLVRVADGMKGSQQFANTSRTSLGTNAVALLGTFWANPLLGIATAGGQFGAGKALASPAFAKWLTKMPKKPNGAAALAHINQLAKIAQSEPVIANEVLQLQARLAEAFTSAPTRLAAQEGADRGAPIQGQTAQQGAGQQGSQP